MAGEVDQRSQSAAESLVKATIAVLDNVNIQAHLDRASKETAQRLGASRIKYVS